MRSFSTEWARRRTELSCPLLRKINRRYHRNHGDFNQNNKISYMSSHEAYFRRLARGPPFSRGEEMKYELARLSSFTTWPPWARVRPTELASAGFYYTGNSDHVTCFSCGSDLGEWQPEQKPEAKHRRRSPRCALVLGRDTDNVPMTAVSDPCACETDGEHGSDASADNTGHSGTSGTGSSTLRQDTSCMGLDQMYDILPSLRDAENEVDSNREFHEQSFSQRLESLGVGDTDEHHGSSTSPAGPSVVSHANPTKIAQFSYRLSTFNRLPRDDALVDNSELAKKGFYYVARAEQVRCAECRLRLSVRGCPPSSEIFGRHREASPLCSYVDGQAVARHRGAQLVSEPPDTPPLVAVEPPPVAVEPPPVAVEPTPVHGQDGSPGLHLTLGYMTEHLMTLPLPLPLTEDSGIGTLSRPREASKQAGH